MEHQISMKAKLKQVCDTFRILGELISHEEIKVGNVNCTYKVNFCCPDGMEKSYIVQDLNTYVFNNPVQVMENIDKVTEHIRQKTPKRFLYISSHKGRKNVFFRGEYVL